MSDREGGAARICRTGDQIERREQLRDAEAHARPYMASDGARTDGNDSGVDRSGRRSSVELGIDDSEGKTVGVRHLRHLRELAMWIQGSAGPMAHRSLAEDEHVRRSNSANGESGARAHKRAHGVRGRRETLTIIAGKARGSRWWSEGGGVRR